MKILDWYILKKFLITFLFVVLIFVLVVLIITYSERNGDFIQHNISSKLILSYFLNYAPYVANMITPITVFIAATFVTSRLTSHTEVVAILSGGVSYQRFLRPFMLGAAVISLMSFLLTGWVIPNANKYRVAFEATYFSSGKGAKKNDMHLKVSPTSYVYLRNFNKSKGIGIKFTLEEIQDKKLIYKLRGEKVVWNSLNGTWTLRQWSLRTIKDFGEDFTYETQRDTVLTLNLTPDDFKIIKGVHETLDMKELDAHIDDLKLKGADNIPVFEIEKLMRYMSPFTALILTFIGVNLSSKKSRNGVGGQMVIGFFLAFIFILLFMTTRSLAQTGGMNPLFAVWLPNIIFTALSLFIYRLVPKQIKKPKILRANRID